MTVNGREHADLEAGITFESAACNPNFMLENVNRDSGVVNKMRSLQLDVNASEERAWRYREVIWPDI